MTPMGFAAYDDATADGSISEQAPPAPPEIADVAPTSVEEPKMDAARTPLDYEAAAALLSERDRRILEFERQWWKYAGAKEQAIRDLFDMSATRYYQIVNGLIDTPEALAFDPMLVKRLRRMRASRQRARSARRLGIDLSQG
jgi:hypothetical protein